MMQAFSYYGISREFWMGFASLKNLLGILLERNLLEINKMI